MAQKRIAIVTGASSGIGKRIAEGIPARSDPDALWVIARSGDKLRALKEELPVPVRALPYDLTKQESLCAIAALLAEEQPDVRILVNAGGYGKFERFEAIAEEDAAGMLDLNCRALTLLMRAVLPYCSAGSIIVNIASVAAFQPVPYGAEYAATKAYVLALSRAVGRELRSEKVRVLAVCPYWTKTDFFGRANKGFSMNFGGKGKSAANTNATKNNTATQSNAAKGAAAANPAARAGLFGFLGGLGMMGMMMLGVGIFGGGFLLYVLAMMLIPVISSFFANKQKMQNQEIPTSSYSTNDLFKKPVDEEEKGSRRF